MGNVFHYNKLLNHMMGGILIIPLLIVSLGMLIFSLVVNVILVILVMIATKGYVNLVLIHVSRHHLMKLLH